MQSPTGAPLPRRRRHLQWPRSRVSSNPLECVPSSFVRDTTTRRTTCALSVTEVCRWQTDARCLRVNNVQSLCSTALGGLQPSSSPGSLELRAFVYQSVQDCRFASVYLHVHFHVAPLPQLNRHFRSCLSPWSRKSSPRAVSCATRS